MLQWVKLGRRQALVIDESAVCASKVLNVGAVATLVDAGVAARNPISDGIILRQVDVWMHVIPIVAPTQIDQRDSRQSYLSLAVYRNQ